MKKIKYTMASLLLCVLLALVFTGCSIVETNAEAEEPLELFHYGLPDMAELQELTGVTSVIFWLEGPFDYLECPVKSLAMLTMFPNLTDLTLIDRSFGYDLSVLKELNLTSLSMSGRGSIGDLSPISEMYGLESLYIDARYSLIDLSVFKNLTNLRELHIEIQYGSVVGYDSISKLLDLTSLTLTVYAYGMGDTPRSEHFGVFVGLPNLVELNLLGEFDDLSPLEGMTGLRYLKIEGAVGINEEDIETLKKRLPDCEISIVVW
jgi:hypothetical protein